MSVLRVIGVPSSAAAYCVGVESAPSALRAAGLIRRLEEVGVAVVDGGDLTRKAWRPDRASPRAQNVDEEAETLREVVDAAVPALGLGERLLVLGGACTVAVGVCASLRRVHDRARLLYIDRHLDLNTPETTDEGSLSWMGMAHALGLPGTVEAIAGVDGAPPLLRPDDLSYLGVQPGESTAGERDALQTERPAVVEQDALVADPAAAAHAAMRPVADGPFAVHVDVDVLDFMDAPLAENVNGRNSGPTIEQLGIALGEILARPECRAVSIGQLHPGNASSDTPALGRFVAMLAGALAPR